MAKLIAKLCFESGLLGAAQPTLVIGLLWVSDMVLPLVDLRCLDETGSSCKASLIALFCER
jgi:hypothetical protein